MGKDARVSTELLKEPPIELAENRPISSSVGAYRGETNQNDALDAMFGSLGIAGSSKARLQADTDRWDGFWERHGIEEGLFDKLLWPTRRLFSARHAKLLMRYMRRHSAIHQVPLRVLEVGCGSATTSSIIAKTAAEATIFGVDLSQAAIKVARARNPDLHCVVADATALPFAREKFSLAFSSGVIEHFDRSIADQMHAEHCRVARNGGTVGLIVPWKHSLYNLLRILSGDHWPFGHENPFSIAELGRFTRNHSIRDVEVNVSYGATLTSVGRKQEALAHQKKDAKAISQEKFLEYAV